MIAAMQPSGGWSLDSAYKPAGKATEHDQDRPSLHVAGSGAFVPNPNASQMIAAL